jgi:hypothetical protein
MDFLRSASFGEAGVDFVEMVAVERVAEFFETVGEGATTGMQSGWALFR